MSDIVQKLWGFCHTLRHEGIDYGDYIEQLTYLLFLKMADERGIDLSEMKFKVEKKGKTEEIEVDCSWPTLVGKTGTSLRDHYSDVLRALGQQRGVLGDIFAGAQSRFNEPVSLKKLLGLIDETEWTALDVDVKAAAFEGLLEKAASEGKKGAGQYFTPRILIKSIVRCMKPDPRAHKDFTICDPACGTGGFLVGGYEWLIDQTGGAMPRELAKRLKSETYFGQDLVERPRRLALMNLYLHGLEPHIERKDSIYEIPDSRRFDVVMTNPPFGTKGANQAPTRDDFTISTSNKQLNFIQHVMTILKPGGRAAIVVPDNCLFADQAGEVFKILTEDYNLHTVLRLPNGTFVPYSPGTKTNVIFFTKGYATETVWVYDGRTNVPHITKKDRPLVTEQFAQFERCFGSDPNGKAKRKSTDSKDDRWRSFSIEEVKQRDYKIDSLKWLKDESLYDGDESLEPEELATDAIAELQAATEELTKVLNLLESENGNSTATTAKTARAHD
jgi:type I restriction enzyme M protein